MVIHIFIAAAAGGIYDHIKDKKRKKRNKKKIEARKNLEKKLELVNLSFKNNNNNGKNDNKSNNINPNFLITLNNLTPQQLKKLERPRKKPNKIRRFLRKLGKSIKPYFKPAVGIIVLGCICVSVGIPISFNIELIGSSGSLSACVWHIDNNKSSNKHRITDISSGSNGFKNNYESNKEELKEDVKVDIKKDVNENSIEKINIPSVYENNIVKSELKDVIDNNLKNYLNKKENSIDKLYNDFFPNNKIEESFANSFEHDYNTDFLKKMKKNSGYYDISSQKPGLRLSNNGFSVDIKNNGFKYNSNVNLSDNIGIGKEIGINSGNIFTGISVLSNDERTTCGFGIDSPNSINNEIFYYCSKHKKIDAPRLATVKIYNARRDFNVNVLGYTGSQRGELVLKGDELQYTERIGVSYNMLSNFGGAFVYKALGKQILKTGVHRASVLVGVR